MKDNLFWAVTVFGIIGLIGAFIKMKDGFGPFNLKVLVVILSVVFGTLTGFYFENSNAVFGIIGTITGYAFGIKSEK